MLNNGKTAPYYYYRDKDLKEIDLLIVQDKTIYPLKIKRAQASAIATYDIFRPWKN